MRLKFEVTEDHIERGTKGSMARCPIALALEDAGCGHPNVAGDAMMYRDGQRWYAPKHEGMQAFINAFDKGLSVKPQIFEVDFEPYPNYPVRPQTFEFIDPFDPY